VVGDFLGLLATKSSGSVVLQGARNKIHGNPQITSPQVLVEVEAEAAGVVGGAAEGEVREEVRGMVAVLGEDTQRKDWASQGEWRQNESIPIIATKVQYPQFQKHFHIRFL